MDGRSGAAVVGWRPVMPLSCFFSAAKTDQDVSPGWLTGQLERSIASRTCWMDAGRSQDSLDMDIMTSYWPHCWRCLLVSRLLQDLELLSTPRSRREFLLHHQRLHNPSSTAALLSYGDPYLPMPPRTLSFPDIVLSPRILRRAEFRKESICISWINMLNWMRLLVRWLLRRRTLSAPCTKRANS